MDKKKTELDFIHRFIPSKLEESGASTATRRRNTEVRMFTTFLLLHGTGGDEQDLIPLAYELDKRAAILSPRGKVLENGVTPRFFRRLAEGVFDLEDLKFRTNELADFVIDASKTYNFDSQHIIAVGYSNGANIYCFVQKFFLLLFCFVLWFHLFQRHCQILLSDFVYRLFVT